MRRQDKYPDTHVFHFHNANPKNRFTTDCVIRALCTALEIPYSQVVMELAKLQCETGYDDGDNKLYGMYLEQKGWTKQKQPRKEDNTKYTGEEFCIFIARENRRYVANVGGNHTVAIVNKRIYDTWDSTEGCVGNYWTK